MWGVSDLMDGDLEGGGVVEGVSPPDGGSKRPHLSPKGLTAMHDRDLAGTPRAGLVRPCFTCSGACVHASRFAVGASKCLIGWVYGGGHPSKDL